MVWMALPYTIVLSIVGVMMIESGFLVEMTSYFYDSQWLIHHSAKDIGNAVSGH